ncbi:MAG: aspartate kinase [Dehalococcoidia bacterium]|nr:aspartate kinase [Dehalococcoidia bacterium]
MALIVQKYGGSSLADAERIQAVARRIAATQTRGDQVVAVCSAMGDATDDLLALARKIMPHPEGRELDVLLSTGEMVSCALVAMALNAVPCPAVSLTGQQAGIQAGGFFGKGLIAAIEPQRVLKELEAGRVVVVAGFQGVSEDMDVMTLGRGGSDVTAVALAAALKAERCEIYTDVAGIYTADPRVVPEARKLPELDYEEMLELAAYGAKMQPRSIELAELYNVPMLVASSFTDTPGTAIRREVSMEVRERVRGVVYDLNVAKITVQSVPDRPGVAATLFEPLAAAGVSVDTIVQNASIDRTTDLSFTVARTDVRRALEVVKPVAERIHARGVTSNDALGKVSIVGTGMQFAPGYAARMFRTLADAGVNIEMITTSEIRITCIVNEAQVHEAVRTLHRAFRLEASGASK